MKRRQALKRIGFGLSIGCASPWLLGCDPATSEPAVKYDGHVVVIGAGATGLYLASILQSKGIRVTVLEARGEIGGRINSYNNANRNVFNQSTQVELGANVIYGSNSILAMNLAEAQIPVVNIGDAFIEQFVINGTVKSAIDWGADNNFVAARDFVKNLPTQSGNLVTVSQAVAGLPPPSQELLNSWVGNLYGTSNASIGLSGLAEALKQRRYNNDFLTLKGNLMQSFFFSRFYAERYPIMLNAPVTAINYGSTNDAIDITYGEGKQMKADKAILTVPISVLKDHDITFAPDLPSSMKTSMTKIGMDASIRVILEFKKNFWGNLTNLIWGLSSAPHCLINGIGALDGGSSMMMSITINGPKAVEFSALGQNMVNEILSELDALYGGQATRFIRKNLNTDQYVSVIKDWSHEKYIKGGYSYPLISASQDDYANLGKPIEDKLFFAGEATDVTGYAGTVNGALSSAERVSDEVIQSILKN